MMRICLLLLILCYAPCIEGGRMWYVGQKGNDIHGCGTQKLSPCKTLRYTVPYTQSKDTVFLEGGNGAFTNEDASDYIYINHTLTIAALNGTEPVIQCSNQSQLFFVGSRHEDTDSKVTVMLKDLTIRNCKVPKQQLGTGVNVIHNARLSIYNCTLENNGLFLYHPQNLMSPCALSELLIFNSTLKLNQISKPFVAGITLLGCNTTTLIMTNNTLQTSPIRLQGKQDLNVTIVNASIDGTALRSSSLDITLANNTNIISLTRVTVSKHSYSRDSSITIAVNAKSAKPPYINFKQVTFHSNKHCKSYGGALSLIARFNHNKPVLMNCFLKKVAFINNTAQTSGGAVYIKNVANIQFNMCFFENNIGTNGGAIHIANGERISVLASVFEGNIARQAPTIMTTGGAISASDTELYLQHSNFTNNTAGFKGSAIFTDNLVSLNVQQSLFTHTAHTQQDNPNTVISAAYSDISQYQRNRTVQLTSNAFNVTGYSWTSTIIDIKAPVLLTNNYYSCGTGQRKNFTGVKSLHGFTYDYNDLVIWCRSCPYGYYTLSNNLYNTDQLNSKSNDSVCLPCPSGAHCVYGIIIPNKNYWAEYYNKGHDLKLHLCPSYQCDSGKEKGVGSTSGCSQHRSGPMCAQCKEGYRKAVKSRECTPTAGCMADEWLTLIILLFACFYVALLLTSLWVWKRTAQTSMQHRILINKSNNRNADDEEPAEETEDHPVVPLRATGWGLLRVASNLAEGAEEDSPLLPSYQSISPALSTTQKVPCPVRVALLFVLGQLLSIIFTPLTKDTQFFFINILWDFVNLRPLYSAFPRLCVPVLKPFPGEFILSTIPVWIILAINGSLWCILALISRCWPPVVELSRGGARSTWRLRVWSACQYFCGSFLLAVIITHLPLLKISFQMLSCTKLEQESIIYEGGDGVQCMQGWQWGLIVYVVFSVATLAFAVELASRGSRLLTIIDTLLLPAAPFVYVIKFCIQTCRRVSQDDRSVTSSGNDTTQVIMDALMVHPFKLKPSESNMFTWVQPNTWLTGILARSLILVCLCVFLSALPGIKAITVDLACFGCLGYHLSRQNLASVTTRYVENYALVTLSLCASMNLFCAVLYELSFSDTAGSVANLVSVCEVVYCIVMAPIVFIIVVDTIVNAITLLCISVWNRSRIHN